MKGMKLPPGCILDKHGQPSVEPGDFFDGGTHIVFGGYKGYAFSLLTCLLGALTGVFEPDTWHIGGIFVQAIDVSAFQPLEAYQQNVSGFLNGIRSVPPAPGFSEVLIPGDLERHALLEQSVKGIELPETVVNELRELGEKYNLPIDKDFNRSGS